MDSRQQLEELLGFLDVPFITGSFMSENGEYTNLSISALLTRDSKYIFNYEGKSILHFTDLNSALLILKSGVLRSRSIDGMKDKSELCHGLKCVSKESEHLTSWKQNTYISCFTPLVEAVESKNDFYEYQWNNYANNHKGVAFEFEISHLYWPFEIFNVRYSNNIVADDFYNYLKSREEVNEVTLEALIPLLSIIKDEEYRMENEIRILGYFSNNIEDRECNYSTNFGVEISKENTLSSSFINLAISPIYKGDIRSLDVGSVLELKKIYIGKNWFEGEGRRIFSEVFIPYCKGNKIEVKLLESS